MSTNASKNQGKMSRIDPAVFWPATIVTLSMLIYFLTDPKGSAASLGKIHAFTTSELGWFFLLCTFAAVCFCVFLGLSRYGKVVLGRDGDQPEFKTLTWLGMIFTSGTGGSLLYLGAIEWVWIMQAPPFGVEKASDAAARWASAYGMFHWGPSAWAWYIVVAVATAYFFYVRKQKTLKTSELIRPVLGKHSDGFLGHAANFLFMFGILGGVMTSLALGTPLISNTIVYVAGMEKSNAYVDTLVIFLWTFIPLMTLVFSLKKGLAIMSDWNVRLDILMLVGIAVCGPLSFILNQSVDGLGLMLQNFIYMSLTTDAISKGGFPQGWTIFYFSWWVVYALPFGLFIAKISKGRTIKELVFGGLGAGSLGCMVFYMVLSGLGIYMQKHTEIDLLATLDVVGRGPFVLRMLETLPFPALFATLFGAITLISYWTGHCAVGYSLAAATQKEIGQDESPMMWNISFWLILAGGVSLALYFLNPESLKPLQTVSILTGFPLCFVIYLVAHSFLKQINKDFSCGFPQADAHGKFYVTEEMIEIGNKA